MGSLTYNVYVGGSLDDNAACRFGLPEPYYLLWVRVHFNGGDTSTATVGINVDHHLGPTFDCELDTVTGCGTSGAEVNWNVPEEDRLQYVFYPGDLIVLTWTNPDTGNMEWGAEVALAPVRQVIGD